MSPSIETPALWNTEMKRRYILCNFVSLQWPYQNGKRIARHFFFCRSCWFDSSTDLIQAFRDLAFALMVFTVSVCFSSTRYLQFISLCKMASGYKLLEVKMSCVEPEVFDPHWPTIREIFGSKSMLSNAEKHGHAINCNREKLWPSKYANFQPTKNHGCNNQSNSIW